MFWPQGKKVKVRQGTNVLRAAREARLHIATRCGGQAACLLCKVRVEKGARARYPRYLRRKRASWARWRRKASGWPVRPK